MEEVKDALCLGISVVTGPMIRETVDVAKAIKKWNPDFPVILGGWHPSLLPGQTLEAPYVDIIVRAQGEDSMLEVANRLRDDAPLDDVLGIGFKRDGKLHLTPERPLKTLDKMPAKAYHLADFDGSRKSLRASLDHVCFQPRLPLQLFLLPNTKCCMAVKWNALPVEQVVEETIELTRRYNLELLWMADDNFLVDLDRALQIAEGLVRAGGTFKWSVQATTNLTARLSIDELTLLRRSGLHQICQGIETASPTVMKLMNKDFQILGDIYQSTERYRCRTGVIPSFNIIFGFPGEGPKDARDGQLHDGYLPKVSRRRVLDQHFHALSGLANFSPGGKTWHRSCPSRLRRGWTTFLAIQFCPGSKEGTINACKPCATICASPLIVLPSRLRATAVLRRRFNISLLIPPGYA